jgi:hypothetical protein
MGAFLIPVIGKVLDRVLPDKVANDAAKASLLQLQIQGELEEVLGQIKVDETEAASSSTFVAGWRPFIGWICGVSLATDFIVRPLVIWICNFFHHAADFPTLDMTELMPLVLGMLGLAGAHAWENVKTGNGNSGGK